MAETNADLWRRLVAEGGEERWQAYQNRWKALKRRFGLTKEQAKADAAKEFPPLKPGDPVIPSLSELPPDEEDEDEPPPKKPPPEPVEKRPPGRPRKERPPEEEKPVAEKPPAPEPPKPLTLNLTLADYDRLTQDDTRSLFDIVVWVNNALPFYQSFEAEKRESDLKALLQRAPSAGAIALLQNAARDPKGFFSGVYSKTVMKYKLADGDTARRDDNRPVFDLLAQFEEDLQRAS